VQARQGAARPARIDSVQALPPPGADACPRRAPQRRCNKQGVQHLPKLFVFAKQRTRMTRRNAKRSSKPSKTTENF